MGKNRDEVYVDKLMMYVLWNELLTGQTEASIQTLSEYMDVRFPFALLDEYYVVFSGVERAVYRTYGISAIDYDRISTQTWPVLTCGLDEMGYDCDCAMQFYEDEKPLIVVISPRAGGHTAPAQQAARFIHDTLQKAFDEEFGVPQEEVRNYTIYSPRLSGSDVLKENYYKLAQLHARAAFFQLDECCLTEAQMQHMRVKADKEALNQAVRSLFAVIADGDQKTAMTVYQEQIVSPLQAGLSRQLCYQVADNMVIHALDLCSVYDLSLPALRQNVNGFTTQAALFAHLRQIIEALCDHIQRAQRHFSRITRDAVLIIKQNYRAEITLTDLAERIGVAPSYLSRTFNNDMGLSIPNYILRLRIEQAQKLLKETGQSVKQISESVGFASDSYFGRLFRAHTGVSPGGYREKQRTAENGKRE